MTMSMYSSITPDDFHGGADEDVFGKKLILVADHILSNLSSNEGFSIA